MLNNCGKKFQRWIFAWFYGRFVAPGLSKQLRPCKKQLFEPLKNLTSGDPDLAIHGQGVLRILEIGIGTGLNLEFYPPGSRLVSVEPNEHFQKFFSRNQNFFSHIILEKSVLSNAEDMSEVRDGTIDAVVSTYVLCSVSELNTVLKEIVRILVPGGKFFYLEHVPFGKRSWSYWLQLLVEPIWKLFSDDCRLTSETSDEIRNVGFTNIVENNLIMEEGFYVLRPHILGVATK